MDHLTELELWHRRHEELLREAENERLARRLRSDRPKDASRTGALPGPVHVRMPWNKGVA